MKENTFYSLVSIGSPEKTAEGTIIRLFTDFKRGLKNSEYFSHFRVFWCNPLETSVDIRMTTISAGSIELKDGILKPDKLKIPQNSIILDIKPYMPSEDRLEKYKSPAEKNRGKTKSSRKVNTPCEGVGKVKASPIGVIETEGKRSWIKLKDKATDLIADLSGYSHLNIIWYFNRFDSPVFRKMLVCRPPYEAPRTGVFASRAPVRPNPLALSVCRILKTEPGSGKIFISNCDAFSGTPVMKIIPYTNDDYIPEVKLPAWLSHWPEYIADTDNDKTMIIPRPAEVKKLAQYTDSNKSELSSITDEQKSEIRNERKIKNIILKGGRQNNLKDVNVSIPLNKMTVVTGVSGSGKSSLAFDTLFAEGQRRFLQCLSPAAAQAAGLMEKPEYDSLKNLIPAVALEQRTISSNPRSTVGSVSEVYSFLRLLFAGIGTRYCTGCGKEIFPVTSEKLLKLFYDLIPGTEVEIHSGRITRTKTEPFSIPQKMNKEFQLLLLQKIKTAYEEGKGFLTLVINSNEIIHITDRTSCTECSSVLMKITPSFFSYNSPAGMCQECSGLGRKLEVDPDRIITIPEKSLLDGASPWYGNLRKYRLKPSANWMRNEVLALAETIDVDLELAWKDLPDEFRHKAMYGSGDEVYTYSYNSGKTGRSGVISRPVGGAVNHLRRLFSGSSGKSSHELYKFFLSELPCPECNGDRLAPAGRMSDIAGMRYPQAAGSTVKDLLIWLKSIDKMLSPETLARTGEIIGELKKTLENLIKVGLYYLPLDRAVTTISGGEAQRIRLAGQLGSGLSGLLYVLDEPSKGLHSRDHAQMIELMKDIRNQGNTLVVVEHDEETMLAADYIIDVGPGAGINGGEIISRGTPSKIMKDTSSVTGPYLSGIKKVEYPDLESKNLIEQKHPFLSITGASLHNLKDIDASFPLGKVSAVTGVSGSGKTTLIHNILVPALLQKIKEGVDNPDGNDTGEGPVLSGCARIRGWESINKMILADQSSIGRSPRSIPATYIGVFDEIRKVFGETEKAKTLKFSPSRFSFNDKSGQCPECEGMGRIKIDMSFLPDSWIVCQDCGGKRYNRETLEILYNGKTIAGVLELDIAEALDCFRGHPKIEKYLNTMIQVGLDYLKLGQNSVTLSGGEAQRIKLARELTRPDTGNTLYILDEPTTGLHFADISRLLLVLHSLAEAGNTVIIIEHNLDVIKSAHWIVDLGPEGGDSGGRVMGQGTVEEIMKLTESYTGQYLKKQGNTR